MMKTRSLMIRTLASATLPATFAVAAISVAALPSALDATAGAMTNRTTAERQRRTKYLFIDRAYVQRLEGVDQVFHQPVKERGPVVAPDRAWEQDRLHLWNAPVWSQERSRWQMWYYGGEDLLPLYAESPDGLRWDKPWLGLVDWKGSAQNNIINLGFKIRSPKENRIVLLRDDLETDPAQRFKGLVRLGGALVALVSGDGLDWKRLESGPIPSDDEYRLSYDALNQFTHLKRELIEQAGLWKSPDEPLGAIFLARLRLDGFASLGAGPQPGSVLTVPVKVAARKLCVNADAKAGELRVEIRDAKDDTAIPGYALEAAVPVCENATCVPIRWEQKSDVSELAGRQVRLCFSLRNAHLYSFWFDD